MHNGSMEHKPVYSNMLIIEIEAGILLTCSDELSKTAINVLKSSAKSCFAKFLWNLLCVIVCTIPYYLITLMVNIYMKNDSNIIMQ